MNKSEELDYEGEMAKSTLKKLIVFSQELLPMIEDDTQLPAWLQDKFSKLDYYINTVYSYMKFSELETNDTDELEENTVEDDSENNSEDDSEDEQDMMELEINLDEIVKK